MANAKEKELVIPVIHETFVVEKEIVEVGKVTLHKKVYEEKIPLNESIAHEHCEVTRIAIDKMVTEYLASRIEGDTTIIPVVKEVLVVEKRYVIIEEIHMTKVRTVNPHYQEISLFREEVTVERENL